MSHTLNFPEFQPVGARVRTESTAAFLANVLGSHSVGMLTRTQTTTVVDGGRRFDCDDEIPVAFAGGTTTTSLLVQAAHQAYACHLGLGLRPEVVWYAIVSEVSKHIRQNVEAYRNLLGPDSKQSTQTLTVYWSNPGEVFENFYQQLSQVVGPQLSELFVPSLTTVDEEARIALVGAFMEAAGSYHNYQLRTICGISRIKIEGEPADWLQLKRNVIQFMELFPPLGEYLGEVQNTLDSIYCTVAGLEINLGTFWEDLYKWYDGGSGGVHIHGWITSLFAHTQTPSGPQPRSDFLWWKRSWRGFELGDFPSHVSQVPILRTGSGYDNVEQHLIAGVLGMDHTDEDVSLLTPRLGWGLVAKH